MGEKTSSTKKDTLKRPSSTNDQPTRQERKKKKTEKSSTTTTANLTTQPEQKLSKTEQKQQPTTKTSTDEANPSNTAQQTTAKAANNETAIDPNSQEEILSTKVPFIKPSQIDQAVTSLLEYAKKSINQNSKQGHLFADEVGSNQSFFNLVITLKRIMPKPKHKPVKISLEHPLYDPRISPVCLIVKDPQREYKDLLEDQKIHFITKVVGLSKLKGKHSSYEARRLLLQSHALFLADERVTSTLPGILGSKFYEKNRLPIAVDLTNSAKIKSELEKAISSTSLRIGTGSCLTIKFADLSRHTHQEITQNLVKVLEQLGKKIPLGGWRNIQSVHIKTGTSTSLPIWIAELGQDSPFSRFNLLQSPEELEKIKAAQEKRQADKEKREANKKKSKREKISNKLKV